MLEEDIERQFLSEFAFIKAQKDIENEWEWEEENNKEATIIIQSTDGRKPRNKDRVEFAELFRNY